MLFIVVVAVVVAVVVDVVNVEEDRVLPVSVVSIDW